MTFTCYFCDQVINIFAHKHRYVCRNYLHHKHGSDFAYYFDDGGDLFELIGIYFVINEQGMAFDLKNKQLIINRGNDIDIYISLNDISPAAIKEKFNTLINFL